MNEPIICTCQDLVDRALDLYEDKENWTYNLGGLGELGQSERARNLYNYYYSQPDRPVRMDLPYKEWLEQYGMNKHTTDCSNFINVLLGYPTNHYSIWLITQGIEYDGKIEDAPAGTVLYMQGHVGLSLGSGDFIDMPYYKATFRTGKIKGSLWKKAYFLKEVDYTPYDIVDIKVEVIERKRYVGEAITYNDFKVTNVYADGTERENRCYNYTPGFITYDVCNVAIVYKHFTKYVSLVADRSGECYCVMLPYKDSDKALQTQKELIDAGYSNAAVVQI